ncbi:MAG TPA: hypothetical protein VM328_05815 [Fimbriimonadaceae bacterium]|nr:hypothetical protein [Fimbriimonadaceae bacterium]
MQVTEKRSVPPNPDKTSQWIWATDGKRYYRKMTLDDGITQEEIFDGEREHQVMSPPPSTNAKPWVLVGDVTSLAGGTHPLEGTYMLNGAWIGDILATGRFKVVGEEAHPKFGRIVLCRGTDDSMRPVELDFAIDRGAICIRALFERGNTVKQIEVSEISEHRGLYLPSDLTARIFVAPTGKRELARSSHMTARVVGVNDVPEEMLTFSGLPEMADVTNRDSFRQYKVLGGQLVELHQPINPRRLLPAWAFIIGGGFVIVSGAYFVRSRILPRRRG